MKECGKIKKLLSRSLDKETNSDETIQVITHLEKCFLCKNEFLELSRVKKFVSGKERKSLPQDYLVDQLRDKIINGYFAEEKFLLADIGVFARKLLPIPVAVIALSLIFLTLSSKQQASKYSLEENILCGTPATTETALKLILGV